MKDIVFNEQHWQIASDYFVFLNKMRNTNYTPYHTNLEDLFYESLGLGKEYCFYIERNMFKYDSEISFVTQQWTKLIYLFRKHSGHYPTYIKSLNESNVNSLHS